jgi:hypothetical protein
VACHRVAAAVFVIWLLIPCGLPQGSSLRFKVFCPEAIFTVKSEDIVPAYRYIFDNAFSFVKSLVNECGYKLQVYSFEFVYRMFAEEPGGIMPIPEEGSILNYDYDLD